MKRILALDGGGIRGVFSLEILLRMQTLLRQLVMRIARRRNHHQLDGRIPQHLLHRPRHLHSRISIRRLIPAPLHDTSQLQPRSRLHNSGVKYPPRQSKSNHPNPYRFSHSKELDISLTQNSNRNHAPRFLNPER